MANESIKEGEFRSVIDWGLASNNKINIIKFLNKLYSIPFDKPDEWEALIFDFFSKEFIVPYIVCSSLDDDNDEVIIEQIKDTYLRATKWQGTIIWNSDEAYRDLITIKESLDTGVKLKEFLPYLFTQNNLLRGWHIKNTDKDDSRFKNFGAAIQPICCECKDKKNKVLSFETIYFILPDKDVVAPIKIWHKEISKKWRLELKRKLNPKSKPRRRDPIESRLRHEVFKGNDYKCVECGKGSEETTLHVDHIKPISQGGTDELDNLQTLCQACNLAKSNREWKGGK